MFRMRATLLGTLAVCVLTTGCIGGPFSGAPEVITDCRITSVSASAKLDDQGNQVSQYQYQFFAESGCGNAIVAGAYNNGTKEATEKVRRAGMSEVSTWTCQTDPWLTEDPSCQRIEMLFQGTEEASQADLDNYNSATVPLSSYPLVAIDRNALRGQLSNAVKELQRTAGSEVVDYGGCACDSPPAAPASYSTGPIVEKGAKGPNVVAIQYLLRQSGAKVETDGDFGNQTDTAIRAFQGAHSLGVDGKVGPATWNALWVTVRKGSTEADAVRAVQTLLNWHGVNVQVDGDFGNQTDTAVHTFQQSENLATDGVVGRGTWTALVNAP